MDSIAIRAENLGKRYQLGERERYRTLRDSLSHVFSRPFSPSSPNYIWALKQVSFEVWHGEAIGIIGPNGAGKSTLLKILSRITEPTEGSAKIHGRVGSLLEVGTGFHPELTGRENIYLNGAILGMKKSEISRRFDEIVAFAEVERFLDTPIKYYSSGMYVRLAFAVAAHLEPDILLVDEILAVGDAAFQKKSLGKMGQVAKEGRTVLFVSHNMGAIVQLCPQSILLQSGHVEMIGRSDAVVRRYLSDDRFQLPDISLDPELTPHSPVVLTRCWISDGDGGSISAVDVTQDFCIGIRVLVRRPVPGADIGVRVHNGLGQPLFTTSLSDSTDGSSELALGEQSFLIRIPGNFLAPDTYILTFGAHRPGSEIFDLRENILSFTVEETGSQLWQYYGKGYGNLLVRFRWQPI